MKLLLTGLWLFFLISAFNSANNLFYLVFALFTAFFLAPAAIARRAAAGLGIKLVQNGPLFAANAARIAAEIAIRAAKNLCSKLPGPTKNAIH